MSATGSRTQAGFTLLEALVVVTITAMAGAIMFPRVDRALRILALRETAAGLTADLRIARAQAIRAGAPVQFAVAADGRSYAWTGARARAAPSAILLSSSGPVTFFGDGSASGSTLTAAAGNRAARITVDPATGAAAAAGP